MDAPSPAAPAPGDALTAGVALARALAASLDAVAQAAADPDPVEMVHDARKAMKEYRALLRLVPGEDARAARQETAGAARTLAHSRDKAAAREAVQILEQEGLLLGCDLGDALAAIGDDSAEADAAAAHRATLAGFLAAARARLDGGLAAQAEAADVGRGVARAYRQGRSARFDSPQAMHELRKRVVAHRYQMSFVAAAFGGRGGKRARRAQALRDLLGAYQDMEILRPMLRAAAPPLGPETLRRLELAMAREQKRLRKKARRSHAALFRRRPRRFLRRFRDIL